MVCNVMYCKVMHVMHVMYVIYVMYVVYVMYVMYVIYVMYGMLWYGMVSYGMKWYGMVCIYIYIDCFTYIHTYYVYSLVVIWCTIL